MKLLCLLLLPALLVFQSCKKEESDPKFSLPPATQTGANTLGFEVDGRVWVNYGKRCYSLTGNGRCLENTVKATMSIDNGVRTLSVWAGFTAEGYDENFNLTIDTLRGPGVYVTGKSRYKPLPNAVIPPSNGLFLSANDGAYQYISQLQKPTHITVTRVDYAQRIISGTFEGQLEDGRPPGKYVTIQYGRFDIAYTQ
ncbi:hypothetical protein [Hymenobacter persicinus]|uniref:Uncharacterized protein n=1 Tax=Hymenobacter persicinus TaxID=2025506 RepID=A0A4Q5LDH9_9BACT|nr:hypothetical protein [Hymenobacter persicinus]RYU79955.1 hypothetical protein EWM57_09745 [Hymenobacter persicinus]